MRIFECVLTVTLFFMPLYAKSQDAIESCSKAIKYDEAIIDKNFASKLAIWNTIDRETFDEGRKAVGAGAVIYGIPANLSYEQFDTERTRLRQSSQLQQNLNFSSSAKWQAVDAGSTERYIECIDKNATKKFTAAIVFATREFVSIHVKKVENNGQINRDVVKVVLATGAKPSRKTAVLMGNSGTSLSFARTIGAPFAVSLVLFSPTGEDLDAADIALPKFTNIRNDPIPGTKSSNHVTCVHTFLGPAQAPMRIVADLDEVLVDGTHEPHYTFIDGAGPGTVSHALLNSSERMMEMEAKCSSETNHTSANFDMWFDAKTLRDNFVDGDLMPPQVQPAGKQILNKLPLQKKSKLDRAGGPSIRSLPLR